MHNAMELSKSGLWGDQGDGTYINPILPGDYSDPDVIGVGSDYYCISSTFHLSPGMIVMHSKDLVNWSSIGHVVDDITQISPKLNYDKMNHHGRGIWAGAIRFHNGKFWVYFCTPDEGFFMSTATNPEGPWEPLQHIWDVAGWDDCCPFWDDDGQGYLATTHFADNYQMHLIKMSNDGKQLLMESDVIFHQYKGSEASKLYKINELYYFFHSEIRVESGNEVRVVMMLRASSLYGPYEEKEILHTHGEELDREPNQGGLVQAPTGEWLFITHHGSCGYLEGRTLSLLPVTWMDGWPIIGEDIDGDGIGEMVWGGKKPIAGYPIVLPNQSDDFKHPKLKHHWEWSHQPRSDKWSLTERPGFLRLHACIPLEIGNFFTVCNVLTQRAMKTAKSEVIVKIDLTGMEDGQEAGICHMGTQYCTLGVCQQGSIKRLKYNDTGTCSDGPIIEGSFLWLKSSWNLDGIHTYAYSLNGEDFQDFGGQYQLNWGFYRGDRVGLYCYNEKTEKGYLDVEWFQYHYLSN
ncbi:glycoside hydrolase family 43 protein [Paenibacillus psychroresistens]|nr:glycoside hydrolase 43 family protein [Paenibacillus psychroresistens]